MPKGVPYNEWTPEQKAAHYARQKRWREGRGRDSHKASKVKYRANLRAETIAAYGGKCSCCGETEPVFLTIDHVNNDGGGRNRKVSGLGFMLELKRQGYPQDAYRLLCFNCNTGRHINGGICPHEQAHEEIKETE